MMSITYQEREARLDWLVRPFEWASNVCLILSVSLFGLLIEGHTFTGVLQPIAYIGLVVFLTLFALILWGEIRLKGAARGQGQ
jgi:NADH:ubiquinone oxidoreductase subunit 6 (subunit J)